MLNTAKKIEDIAITRDDLEGMELEQLIVLQSSGPPKRLDLVWTPDNGTHFQLNVRGLNVAPYEDLDEALAAYNQST